MHFPTEMSSKLTKKGKKPNLKILSTSLSHPDTSFRTKRQSIIHTSVLKSPPKDKPYSQIPFTYQKMLQLRNFLEDYLIFYLK